MKGLTVKRAISTMLCLLAVQVSAQPHTEYKMSGNWSIRIDPSNGNGCYMERAFDSGTLVRIGIVPDRDGAFFAAFNADWQAREAGELSTVLLDFEDSRFQGEVVALSENGMQGGYAFFNNPAFATEFAKRQTVTIVGDSGASETIDLTGSLRAIDQVKACQDEQDEG